MRNKTRGYTAPQSSSCCLLASSSFSPQTTIITSSRLNLAQVKFNVLADGTMANEVHLSHSLLQWPYLTDMSLISSIVSIFVPSWCTGPSHLLDSVITESIPWFYFNLLLKDSQVLG